MNIQPTRYAVVFNGPPGVGKDFAANLAYPYLMSKPELKPGMIKFAEPMKNAVHALFADFFTHQHYDRKGLKDEPTPALHGASPRQRYIEMSEQMVKPIFGDDFFGQVAVRRMKGMTSINTFIFSDCGFTKELEPIIDLVGAKNLLIVQIMGVKNGAALTFKSDSRGYIGEDVKKLHPKVTVVDIPNNFDRTMFTLMVKGALNQFFKIGDDL